MGVALSPTKLVNAYVGFVIIWSLERLLFFDQLWPFALLNTIAQYLFIPLLIFLVISVWHSDEWIAFEAFVGQDAYSDHLPVVAKLGLVTVLYE
jgi:hypothetical protein